MVGNIQRLTMAAGLGVIPMLAAADLTGSAFSITASNADGYATYEVSRDALAYHPETDSFSWSLNGPVELRSSSGALIAGLNGVSLNYVQDPIISMFFSAMAGSSTTTFTISSALLSFSTMSAMGRATAGLTITDGNGDGATLAGLQGSKAYEAHYNGYLGAGSSFKNLVGGFSAGAAQSATNSEDYGWAGMGLVSDMSAQFHFTLTANDMVGGTSYYETAVVPEPATMAVLGLGVAAMLRRRRR